MRPPEKRLPARRGAALGWYVCKFTALCLLFLIASCDSKTDPYSTTVNDREALTKLYSGRARMCIAVCPLLAEWLRPVDGVAASSLSRIIANTA